jgi:hypothetical protein
MRLGAGSGMLAVLLPRGTFVAKQKQLLKTDLELQT